MTNTRSSYPSGADDAAARLRDALEYTSEWDRSESFRSDLRSILDDRDALRERLDVEREFYGKKLECIRGWNKDLRAQLEAAERVVEAARALRKRDWGANSYAEAERCLDVDVALEDYRERFGGRDE